LPQDGGQVGRGPAPLGQDGGQGGLVVQLLDDGAPKRVVLSGTVPVSALAVVPAAEIVVVVVVASPAAAAVVDVLANAAAAAGKVEFGLDGAGLEVCFFVEIEMGGR
jgi:hypothetical protein